MFLLLFLTRAHVQLKITNLVVNNLFLLVLLLLLILEPLNSGWLGRAKVRQAVKSKQQSSNIYGVCVFVC